jgi:NAD(P)-dependent dehydrogenase (short-subunit alcohol dehydrogenase family)
MEHYFKGKTVLVTGAGWGIGKATALLYAACGAKVIVSDTSRRGGKDTLAKIKSQKGNATYIKTDVSSGSDLESSDDQVGLSLTGLHNCMHYEIEAMQKQGGGVIVNTSSIMNARGLASSSQYIEAKYGLVTLVQNVRGEYAAIHINTIAPAFIDTALLKDTIEKETGAGIKLFPMDRHGTIQEVAGLVLWLSSDETKLLSNVSNDTN